MREVRIKGRKRAEGPMERGSRRPFDVHGRYWMRPLMMRSYCDWVNGMYIGRRGARVEYIHARRREAV